MKQIIKKLHTIIANNKYSQNKQVNNDKYEVIMACNIMVAQGWKCDKCKLIRPYNQSTCNCQ